MANKLDLLYDRYEMLIEANQRNGYVYSNKKWQYQKITQAIKKRISKEHSKNREINKSFSNALKQTNGLNGLQILIGIKGDEFNQ